MTKHTRLPWWSEEESLVEEGITALSSHEHTALAGVVTCMNDYDPSCAGDRQKKEELEANLQLILVAVNNHHRLVELLRRAVEDADEVWGILAHQLLESLGQQMDTHLLY